MTRHCLQCSALIKGRTDKRFCDDYCRIRHNNQLRKKSMVEVRTINSRLNRNRKILERIAHSGEYRISLAILETLGFDRAFHTHTLPNENGPVFFCYEYAFTLSGEGNLTLIADTTQLEE